MKGPRAACHRDGILESDAILVPLEDGDRCQALVAMGKEVIVIDLNPLSRSAQQATIAIVDELSRALGNMLEFTASEGTLEVDSDYNHVNVLDEGVSEMLDAFKRT